ncbi:MAG: ATP-binding protein [Methanospirillum sp.]
MDKSTLIVSDISWTHMGTRNAIVHSTLVDFQQGDMVQLQKDGRTVFVEIVSVDRNNRNTIEIDQRLRGMLGVKIGQAVDTVKVIQVPDAESVFIEFSDKHSDFAPEEIKGVLKDQVVFEGDSGRLPNTEIQYKILETKPEKIVRIGESSQVILSSESERVFRIKEGKRTHPAKSDIYSETPDVSFDDIGGLEDVKAFLIDNVVNAVRKSDLYKTIGYEPTRGVLLCGPPGTGKTQIAKATAHEAGVSFIYASASSFKDKYYGMTEKKLRDTFEAAKNNAPCIIFLDEIDAIATARSGDRPEPIVINQLLTLMDDIADLDVYVIAATNVVELVDPALTRPGRLIPCEVPLPDLDQREQIFRLYLKGTDISDADFHDFAQLTDRWSGAQIRRICNDAKLTALKERDARTASAGEEPPLKVTSTHVRFNLADVKQESPVYYG